MQTNPRKKERVKFRTHCQECGHRKEYKRGNPNDHRVCHRITGAKGDEVECFGKNDIWVCLK